MFRVSPVSARRASLTCLLTLLPPSLHHLHAQDRRSVAEPTIPPVCVTLNAHLSPATATSGDVEMLARKAGSDSAGLDTVRIQQALDQCASGSAVELTPASTNSAFLAGPIHIPRGVALLIDKGVTLYASRNPESYAISPGSCGIVDADSNSGCKPFIAARATTGSAVMGDGVIDGQGSATLVLNGSPSSSSWWDLAENARTAGHAQVPNLIQADSAGAFTVYRITLRNSPAAHIAFQHSDGLTVWGVKIDSPASARGTVGVDLAESHNITIAQSFFRTGDDHIAISATDAPSSNITIAHNHLYWGHGLTIGGETIGGVSGIRVSDLSLDAPDNGLRIVSNAARGGLVEDIVYQDVCIRNAKAPIVFDTAYSFPGKGMQQLPVYDDITLHNVRLAGGGKVQFGGFDTTHRITVRLDGVLTLDKPNLYRPQAMHTDFTLGPGPVNLTFIGDDSSVSGSQTKGSLPACSASFIPFP